LTTHSCNPYKVKRSHWFLADLVLTLGQQYGLRLWIGTEQGRFVYRAGDIMAKQACRLSSVLELAGENPVQHFGFDQEHFFPIPAPALRIQDVDKAWAGAEATPYGEHMDVNRHAAAPWEDRPHLLVNQEYHTLLQGGALTGGQVETTPGG
jgi:hypothetical protein